MIFLYSDKPYLDRMSFLLLLLIFFSCFYLALSLNGSIKVTYSLTLRENKANLFMYLILKFIKDMCIALSPCSLHYMHALALWLKFHAFITFGVPIQNRISLKVLTIYQYCLDELSPLTISRSYIYSPHTFLCITLLMMNNPFLGSLSNTMDRGWMRWSIDEESPIDEIFKMETFASGIYARVLSARSIKEPFLSHLV